MPTDFYLFWHAFQVSLSLSFSPGQFPVLIRSYSAGTWKAQLSRRQCLEWQDTGWFQARLLVGVSVNLSAEFQASLFLSFRFEVACVVAGMVVELGGAWVELTCGEEYWPWANARQHWDLFLSETPWLVGCWSDLFVQNALIGRMLIRPLCLKRPDWLMLISSVLCLYTSSRR